MPIENWQTPLGDSSVCLYNLLPLDLQIGNFQLFLVKEIIIAQIASKFWSYNIVPKFLRVLQDMTQYTDENNQCVLLLCAPLVWIMCIIYLRTQRKTRRVCSLLRRFWKLRGFISCNQEAYRWHCKFTCFNDIHLPSFSFLFYQTAQAHPMSTNAVKYLPT